MLSAELTSEGSRQHQQASLWAPSWPGDANVPTSEVSLLVARPSTCTRPRLSFPTHDSTTSSLRKPEKHEEHRAGYRALLTTGKFRLRSGANITPKEPTAVATRRAGPYLRHPGVQHNTTQLTAHHKTPRVNIWGDGYYLPLASPLDLTKAMSKMKFENS